MTIRYVRLARCMGTVSTLLLLLSITAGHAIPTSLTEPPSSPRNVPKSAHVLSIATYNVKLMPDVAKDPVGIRLGGEA